MKQKISISLLLLTLVITSLALPISAQSPVSQPADDRIRLGVDLVVLDALVLQQRTSRPVGDLRKDDFNLYEEGVKQEISHFGRDTLPLSVILLVDRGGCLDPFGEEVRRATAESLNRLKPEDEVAMMAFHDTTEIVQGFTRNRNRLVDALHRMPPHEENAGHCFNRAFYDAAAYIQRAGNPDGRRVIIVITGVTTGLECTGPSVEEAHMSVLESGSVVCGLIPKTAEQRMESGIMRAAAGLAGLFKVKSSGVHKLAEETGGEVMSDKPEHLDRAFNTLVEHLRTRYSLGFVSSSPRQDGRFRKVKLELIPAALKQREAGGKLIVKTRRGYVASRVRRQRI
jgi:Ca-activated chloride channel homolog